MSQKPRMLARLLEVERRRQLDAVAGMLSAIAVGQLFVASFAFGSSLGPKKLSLIEVLTAMAVAVLLAAVVARVFRRRRWERRAELVGHLKEGARKRRVAIYADHLTIDKEVVLLESIDRVEPDNGAVVLRYIDPRHEGPVLRELNGTDTLKTRLMALKPA